MSAYRYRLQALLDLRIAIRDQQRSELAEAIGARQELATQQTRLAAEQQELRNLYQSATSKGQLDVGRLVELQQYEQALRARDHDLALQEQFWTQEIENRQATLAAADRDAKVLQKLGERHRQEHRQLEERLEARRLDECGARTIQAAQRTPA